MSRSGAGVGACLPAILREVLMYRVPFRGTLSRRSLIVGGAALFLSAGMPPAFARTPEDFVAGLWPKAEARGVSRRAFKSALDGFTPLRKVMELTKKQPEFTITAGDYIGKRVTDEQAANGQANRQEWA